MKKRISFGVAGPKNTPVGEAHPKALVSDELVDFIRDLHEEGFLGYGAIARAFKLPKHYVRDVCTFRRRAATPDLYRSRMISDLEKTTMLTRIKRRRFVGVIVYDEQDGHP